MNKKERSQYIKALQSDIASIESIPEEDRNDFELVKVQRKLGRRIEKMGFDVLKQQFFIKESIPEIRSWFDNVFQTFGELYDFAEGKIYDNACYFGYSFSEDEIAKYKIDISNMNFTSFVSETMEDIDIRNDDKVEVSAEALKWKSLFFDSLNKLKSASTLEEIAQTVEDFRIAEQEFGLFYFYSFNLGETACGILLFNWLIHNKNIDLIPEEIWNENYRRYVTHHFFCSLFIIFGEKLFDKLPKYKYTSGKKRYTSQYSRIRKYFATTPETKIKKGYDIQRDIYYINTEYWFMPENFNFCVTTLYFESFDDFVATLNNDLSDCDLRYADLSQYDLSQYKINANTKLGRNNISGSVTYKVTKGFNRRGFYILQELFDSKGSVITRKGITCQYFCDFLHVVGNDLSDCDLLFCEGLENVPDILLYNLENAKVTSETLVKAGKNEKDLVHIDFPVVKKSTFPFALQNEKETKYILSAMREKENTLQRYRVLYISDLHLMHKIINKMKSRKIQTANDIEFFLKSAVLQMLSSAPYLNSPIIIAGDIATLPELYKWFINFLSQKKKNVIVIPGNHELWSMSKGSWQHELDEYRSFVEECGLVFLHNCIAYMCDDYKWQTISEEEIVNMSVEDIRNKTRTARYLIFGGLGFSGYNSVHNANIGLYLDVLDIADDIEETKRFEALYRKIEQCFGDREIIIATHTQMEDWLESAEYHNGWIYISGHNHHNYFYDDGVTRVYADNQLGYKSSNFSLKSISIDGNYDIFEDYSDDIHQITAEQYRDFYRGKNMTMDFNRNDLDIFMLKKKGYYCFISRSQKMRSLCFLEGGRQKQLPVKDIQYYYDHMEEEIEILEAPIKEFYHMQEKISELVKIIGGSGRIHGCIIDIDYYNHIYLNPHGNKLLCYCALDIVKKEVYLNLPSLLKVRCPELFKNYKALTENSQGYSTAIELYGKKPQISEKTVYYPETEMYSFSNQVKSLQYLVDKKVLRRWYDVSAESKDLIFKELPQIE